MNNMGVDLATVPVAEVESHGCTIAYRQWGQARHFSW